MRLLRTIVVVIVAMSLAVLPLGATATALQTAMPGAVLDLNAHAPGAHHDLAAMDHGSHMSMDEHCRPDAGSDLPASKHDGKCQFSPCCVGVSVIAAPSASALYKALVLKEGRFPARIDRFVPDHAGAPPFRPPRV